MAQLFTPPAAIRTANLQPATAGLAVGPISVNWLGNAPQAIIDLTAVVKQTDISVMTALVDNSNNMLGVSLTDPLGNVSRIPSGSLGYVPVSWFPGGYFLLQVNTSLQSASAANFAGALNVPTVTNVTLFNFPVPPTIWKGPPVRTLVSIGGASYFVCDGEVTQGTVTPVSNAAFAAPFSIAVPQIVQIFDVALTNITLSFDETTLNAAAASGFFEIYQSPNTGGANSIFLPVTLGSTAATAWTIGPVEHADMILTSQNGGAVPALFGVWTTLEGAFSTAAGDLLMEYNLKVLS